MTTVEILFTNAYTPTETSVVLTTRKVLSGAELEAGQFVFELTDSDGTVLKTASNDADGAAVFTEIVYSQVGTYRYTVNEIDDAQADITYDATAHSVVVIVTDDGSGALAASVLWDGDETVTEPVFTNTYDQPEEEEDTPDEAEDDDTGEETGDDNSGDGGSDDSDSGDSESEDAADDADTTESESEEDDTDETEPDDGEASSGTPPTGDDGIGGYLVVLLTAAAAETALLLGRRRRRTDRMGD